MSSAAAAPSSGPSSGPSSAPSTDAARGSRAELVVAVVLAACGVVALVDAATLSTNLTQGATVGPRAVPVLVGTLLLVVAVALARDVLRGGRGEPEAGEDVDLAGGTDWRTVGLLAGAFLANAALIDVVGWPISGAVLFFGSVFALGSRHYVRDAVIAVVLSVGTWYLFVLGLGVFLPVGLLQGVL